MRGREGDLGSPGSADLPVDVAVMADAAAVVDLFHTVYYYAGHQTRSQDTWLGVPLLKCPLDLWIYQEIVFKLRPDIVVETGTFHGGSALYLASLFDLIGKGRVYSIDAAAQPDLPVHPRITFLSGSSIDDAMIAQVRSAIGPDEDVLVILDSDHTRDHVLAEMEAYHELVKPGGYLIVEDTHYNGHPLNTGSGPGPMEAVIEFLQSHEDFHVDLDREKFMLTYNRGGYLRRGANGIAPPAQASIASPVSSGQISVRPDDQAVRLRTITQRLLDEIARREDTVNWLHQEIAKRDQMADQLHAEVARRESEIAQLRASLALAEWNADKFREAVASRDQRIRAIKASRLWKLGSIFWTLRAGLRTLRGRRGRDRSTTSPR